MKKNTLLIGGTGGIGKVIYQNLKKRGDNIYIISRSPKSTINHLKCDITDLDELLKLKSKLKKRIDNLIFCQRYRGQINNEDFNLVLKGTQNFIQTFKNQFSEKSSIIILSSIASETVIHDKNLEYHYTRGALEGLIKYLACDLGKRGTRINGIQVTKILKPGNKKFFFKNRIGIKERKIIEKITPLGRIGCAEDVANLCNFLSVDGSSFITGTIIPLDGGARLKSQESIFKTK